MIKMIWKTLAVDKMDIEKTADLKCISRLLVEKWHVDQIKMKITVSPPFWIRPSSLNWEEQQTIHIQLYHMRSTFHLYHMMP